jgi:hypothetical protein
MSDDRKNPLWPWIVSLLLALPVLYVASFGPACWWLSNSALDDMDFEHGSIIRSLLVRNLFPRAPRIYWPLGWLALNGPEPVRQSLCWYANARKKGIMLPTDPGGSRWYRP